MKYLIILLSFLIIGCNSKPEGKTVAEKQQKPLPEMSKTFPFSEEDKVEVISYPVRYEWDTLRVKGDYNNFLVEKRKLMSDPSHFKDRIILDNVSKKKIFEALFVDEEVDDSPSACFDPRHAILFYNKEDIIAYMEICFHCNNARADFKHSYYNLDELEKIFKNSGVKYFGEGKH